MKKQFLKFLTAAAAAILCLSVMMIPASAERKHQNAIENCKFYDIDGVLEEDVRESLSDRIREASDNTDMYIAAYILDGSGAEWSEETVEAFADDSYDSLFNVQYGEESDGVLLVINLRSRYLYISTCGMGELYYYNGTSEDRISNMNMNLHAYLQDEDYAGAVNRFCADAEYYYKQGFPKNGYTYNAGSGMYSYALNGVLVHSEKLPWWFGINWSFWGICAAIVGGIAGLITAATINSKYQLKKSLDPSNYISQKETNFTAQDDTFIRQYTTKHYIDRSSGGGGGGGGFSHTSSGGFSHGGGGSHW